MTITSDLKQSLQRLKPTLTSYPLILAFFILLVTTSNGNALGDDFDSVGIALLDFGEVSHSRPRSVEQLMWEVSKRTSILVREKASFVDLEKDQLFDHPILVWLGQGEAPELSVEAMKKLNSYLRAGGLLFIDDISQEGDQRFDQSIRKRLKQLWPEQALTELKNTELEKHTIYKSFFLLDRPYGRLQRSIQLEGIEFNDFTPVIYSRNDSFGAYGRSATGDWLLNVVPGGAMQREWAFRFGINLIMYATCLNYKQDQVHTLTLLRRRKWRANP
jgi:hypothetical protein